jgi:hypothetical protein
MQSATQQSILRLSKNSPQHQNIGATAKLPSPHQLNERGFLSQDPELPHQQTHYSFLHNVLAELGLFNAHGSATPLDMACANRFMNCARTGSQQFDFSRARILARLFELGQANS